MPDRDEKRLQRALLQFGKPENRAAAIKALRLAGRNDLIGYGDECLLAASSVPRQKHTGKSQDKRTDNGKPGNYDKAKGSNKTSRGSNKTSRSGNAADRRTDKSGRHGSSAGNRGKSKSKRSYGG